VDPRSVLAQFDQEMRARPDLYGEDRVESVGGVVRVVGEHSRIAYSRLDSASAPSAIRDQTDYFRGLAKWVEWKVFGHDQPSNLGELLRAEGYLPDPPETLVALDLTDHPAFGDSPAEVEVRRVRDPADLSAAVAVSEEAFGPGEGWSGTDFAHRLSDPTFGLFLAFVAGRAVSAGRLEMPLGRAFASLWGGGTSPGFRGRGIYRALVRARVEVARSRGFRYLTVDALPTSRPILERVGFVPLSSMTGWVFDPSIAR